jgi:hypothetical protein
VGDCNRWQEVATFPTVEGLKQTRIFVMKTNQMNYLSLIHFVKQPLHVSAVFSAHHQEVFTVYVQQVVRVIRLGVGRVAHSV